jgi:nucleotide-binding universal stress UspA family protein
MSADKIEERASMFRTILVPVDGTELAERALPYATALASPAGHVILLRAEPLVWQKRPPPDAASATPGDPACDEWLSPANPGARVTLEAAAARVQADGVSAEVDFQRYYRGAAKTADVILDALRERQADLVVVSTHGRSGLARWFYGSVADHIVRGANIPVMLVPATVDRPWPEDRAPRILVTLDGSSLAEEILDPIGQLASQLSADLLLLRVVDRLPLSTRSKAPHVVQALVAGELAEASRYLALVRDRVRRVGMSVTARAVTGDPATMIAAIAKAEGVDVIAMATHGRGGLRRLALGSVADSTLQATPVPILLVRPSAATQSGTAPAAGLASATTTASLPRA